MNWDHKDEWRKRGKDFMVVVSRHEVAPIDIDFDLGVNRWAVYAYIYPKHPHFAAFSGPDMWQDATAVMPLHSGASLLSYHYDDKGAILSVQVGADYNHLHDSSYSHDVTQEDAICVFSDADRLAGWLSAKSEAK